MDYRFTSDDTALRTPCEDGRGMNTGVRPSGPSLYPFYQFSASFRRNCYRTSSDARFPSEGMLRPARHPSMHQATHRSRTRTADDIEAETFLWGAQGV